VPRILLLLLPAQLAFGQNDGPSFLPPAKNLSADDQTANAIMEAACEEVSGDGCSNCPVSREGPWAAFRSMAVGHFNAAGSDEAFVGVGSCSNVGRSWPITLILGKRNGTWTSLPNGDLLDFDPGGCMQKKFRSGREFLICEFYDHPYIGEPNIGGRAYRLSTLMIENNELKFHNIFSAVDTTRVCVEGKARQAEVKKIEFHDLNGDGFEDISITAIYGSFPMTGHRLEQCAAAEESSKPFPHPSTIKTYKIDLMFDGNRYTPSPGSRAAAALFANIAR
jgi:hypothetical protein